MFTGIVQESAEVQSFEKSPSGHFYVLYVSTTLDTSLWTLGDSISNNGVCLTIVEKSETDSGTRLRFDVGPETMKVTNFQNLKTGDHVHLEAALKMGDPLGGHLVSGHIDATAKVNSVEASEDILTLGIRLDGAQRNLVAPYLVKKGSVAMNGVSLTINELEEDHESTTFFVTLIPHTLEITHFGKLNVGDVVNIEADIMAKQAARYAAYWKEHHA